MKGENLSKGGGVGLEKGMGGMTPFTNYDFAFRLLIFKLQQKFENWRQNGLETNFLNLENRSFEYVTFSQ